jgi:D-lyxose ketol-isomerase
MKRSEINAIMAQAEQFMAEMNFIMPPFAFWGPDDWAKAGVEARDIPAQQLGWDITDFGSGDYASVGLLMFTIRNGAMEEFGRPGAKAYAEKIMIVEEGQLTPTHFHWHKMEDIINRGGGDLLIAMWNATDDEDLADTPVTVAIDGLAVTVNAGETVALAPGSSVCLPPRLYHKFWGAPGKGTVLVGEVSSVDDPRGDNRFHETIGRFPEIEEDETPRHLLQKDYANYYNHAQA